MRRLVVACLFASWVGAAGAGGELSASEAAWLKAMWPVVSYAKSIGLPLDVIVQPQVVTDGSPLALGFDHGRCLLVLSMRGNREAGEMIDRLAPDLVNAALELMAAHELGHCIRHLSGHWFELPPGFSAAASSREANDGPVARSTNEAASRREEAYGDLVGLAWTIQHHPGIYARLRSWLESERRSDLKPGGPHDTLEWLDAAGDGHQLANLPIFEAAQRLWSTELRASN